MAAKDFEVECDEKGRIHLSKAFRDRYGDTYIVVPTRTGLWLVPRPKDPLAALERIGRAIPEMDLAELKRQIRADAEADALRKWRD